MTETKKKILMMGSDQVWKVLEDLTTHKSQLKLSQNIDGEEISCWSDIYMMNLHTQDLALRPSGDGQFFEFDPTKPLTVTNKNETVSFETEMRRQQYNKLAFSSFPSEIIVHNERKAERTNYQKLALEVLYNNDSYFQYTRRHLGLASSLIDISPLGMSMKSFDPFVLEFKPQDKIVISLINGYSLSQKITGRVVEVVELEDLDRSNFIKISLEFDRQIPLEQIKKYFETELLLKGK